MLSFFPRDVLDEILNLNESVSEGFPTYSYYSRQVMLTTREHRIMESMSEYTIFWKCQCLNDSRVRT